MIPKKNSKTMNYLKFKVSRTLQTIIVTGRGSRGNGGPLSTFAHKICIIVQIVSKKNQQITENILFNIIY
jgi:hypothetical protein